MGSPVHYYLLYPDGRLETAVLGPDLGCPDCGRAYGVLGAGIEEVWKNELRFWRLLPR